MPSAVEHEMKPPDSSGSQKRDPVSRATVWLFFLTLFVSTPISYLGVATTGLAHPHSDIPITMFWILAGAVVVSFGAMIAVHAMPANLRESKARTVLCAVSLLMLLSPVLVLTLGGMAKGS
jgi:FtsH-binding integral membrane protein